MKKLIIASLVFETIAAILVAVLIYAAQPYGQQPKEQPRPGVAHSFQEDVLRTNQRLDAALDNARWSALAMIIISMGAQIICLSAPGRRKGEGQ